MHETSPQGLKEHGTMLERGDMPRTATAPASGINSTKPTSSEYRAYNILLGRMHLIREDAMAMVKKSITLTGQQESWLQAQIHEGHYGNVSEVVRELIRERQLRERETSQFVEKVRAELIKAEESGFTDQKPADILKEIKSRLRR